MVTFRSSESRSSGVRRGQFSYTVNRRAVRGFPSIRQAAIAHGMQTMAEDGWAKVTQGLTTTQEVLRVTQE